LGQRPPCEDFAILKPFLFPITDAELDAVRESIRQWRAAGLGAGGRVAVAESRNGPRLRVPAMDVDDFCALATYPLSPFTKRRLYAEARTYLVNGGLRFRSMRGPTLATAPLPPAAMRPTGPRLTPV
jgi:hypothetical protein